MLRSDIVRGRKLSIPLFEKIGWNLNDAELNGMEVGDFGLNNWPKEGAQIVTVVGTDRVGLKLIALLPGQALPEHWHTADNGELGKEEILRVLHGEMFLFLEGGNGSVNGFIPEGKEDSYLCRDEHVMHAGDQVILLPDTAHWMQGGKEGCVVLSISSAATCARDPFRDPGVMRFPEIIEDVED